MSILVYHKNLNLLTVDYAKINPRDGRYTAYTVPEDTKGREVPS